MSLIFCANISATEQIIDIRTIGIPPYGIEEQGQLSGVYYELANLIVANAGYNARNKIAPYARIVKSLKYGSTDLTIMFRYPELEGYVEYIAPLPSKPLVVIGLEGKSFKNIESLSGKKILYLRGAKFNPQIDNDTTITKYLVSDFILGIKMLVAGRADAIIGPLQSIERAALEYEKRENDKIIFGEPLVFETRTPWIQISRKSRAYLDAEKLKESFLQLQKSDTFNRLTKKYSSK